MSNWVFVRTTFQFPSLLLIWNTAEELSRATNTFP